MRRTIFALIALLLLHQHAIGGGWGQLHGKNSLDQLVVITDDTPNLIPSIRVSTKSDLFEYPFVGECSFDMNSLNSPPQEFSCHAKGKSPLAGTTYTRTGKPDQCNHMVFQCTRNCASPNVPRTLFYEPWEC